MDFQQIRQQFPALRDKIYLDAACVSLAPQVAVDAVRQFLDNTATCPEASSTLHHIAMDEGRAAARPEAARLINSSVDEIALVESTSHGLSLAASAIPLKRGDQVLVCDLEFMQVAIPWHQLQRTVGIEIVPVSSSDGRISADDIERHLSTRTRVIAISSVQWNNGFRCDLSAIGALSRARNIWLVVDAIQQLGATPMDVQNTPVDFLACGGHKWLNSPFGAGFLYINRSRMEELNAPIAGYLSVVPPSGGWGNYFQTPSTSPFTDYQYVDTARRYEAGGTANYPGAIGLAASLRLINETSVERIGGYIHQLTSHLISGLQSLPVDVVTPVEPECRSGIVTFSIGDSARNVELMNWLLERKILTSVRYTSGVGGLRVSSHFYNSIEDIDALLNAVDLHQNHG